MAWIVGDVLAESAAPIRWLIASLRSEGGVVDCGAPAVSWLRGERMSAVVSVVCRWMVLRKKDGDVDVERTGRRDL